MFVEFIGSSGAGKTVLCRQVRLLLRRGAIPVARPIDAMFGPSVTQFIDSPRWTNVLLETLGQPWATVGRRQFRTTDRLVRNRIRDVSISWRERLRLVRSWRRKLAVVCGCRRISSRHRVVLHDEGMVQLATILFGRCCVRRPDDLREYLDHIPLPDWIVSVEAPAAVVAGRLAQRLVQPVPDRNSSDRLRFLQNISQILRQIRRHDRIAARWISVDNSRNDPSALGRVAESVAARITALHVSRVHQPSQASLCPLGSVD